MTHKLIPLTQKYIQIPRIEHRDLMTFTEAFYGENSTDAAFVNSYEMSVDKIHQCRSMCIGVLQGLSHNHIKIAKIICHSEIPLGCLSLESCRLLLKMVNPNFITCAEALALY